MKVSKIKSKYKIGDIVYTNRCYNKLKGKIINIIYPELKLYKKYHTILYTIEFEIDVSRYYCGRTKFNNPHIANLTEEEIIKKCF